MLGCGSCGFASNVVHAEVGLDAWCAHGRTVRLPWHLAGPVAAYLLPCVWADSRKHAKSEHVEASSEPRYVSLAVGGCPVWNTPPRARRCEYTPNPRRGWTERGVHGPRPGNARRDTRTSSRRRAVGRRGGARRPRRWRDSARRTSPRTVAARGPFVLNTDEALSAGVTDSRAQGRKVRSEERPH